ncbi:hypothetical protein MBLNU459_g6794t1 [Dothideomycetes sp. NU459]
MLSRHIRRACLDPAWTLPPAFLLPFAAHLSTVSHTAAPAAAAPAPPPIDSAAQTSPAEPATASPSSSQSRPSALPTLPASSSSSPVVLSESIKSLLPALRAQGPHYITAHIHDRPYLLTAGDTVRLPFLMHGVSPGDVLRLNRATALGSRDFTLKAGAPSFRAASPTATTESVLDPTAPGGTLSSESRAMPGPRPSASLGHHDGAAVAHFVPFQAQGRTSYLDERMFVCRAVVMGVESEPMRIKEKTKRRQRRVKTVRSKHRFTVLKIKEVTVRSAEEVESGVEA